MKLPSTGPIRQSIIAAIFLLLAGAIPHFANAEAIALGSDGQLRVPPADLACEKDSDCVAVHTICNYGWTIINKKHEAELTAFVNSVPMDCEGVDLERPDAGCDESRCVIRPKDGCLYFNGRGECVKKCEDSKKNGYCKVEP